MINEVISNFHMWFVLSLAVILLTLYMTSWISLEISSLLILSCLLLFFQIFPLTGQYNINLLDTSTLLAGFANPALISVMALLVVGEGMVRTGGLEAIGENIAKFRIPPILLFSITLVCVFILSAFLNNTPVVLIFIPILQAIAYKSGLSVSSMMMPLSYAAIIGGMTTVIGSSTNLLISSSMNQLGLRSLDFFEITPLGLILSGVAMVYIIFILPLIMPNRKETSALQRNSRQYISQFVVPVDSELIGEVAVAGTFRALENVTIRSVLSRNKVILPPFEKYEISAGDTFVIAATRQTLTEVVSKHRGLFYPPLLYGLDLQKTRVEEFQAESKEANDDGEKDTDKDKDKDKDTIIVEAMVTPTSRMVGLTLEQFELQQSRKAIFIGIQRRAEMFLSRMTDIRLQSGDVLLLKGTSEQLESLRPERDVVLISGTRGVVPNRDHAKRAALIFVSAVGIAAFGLISITLAAITAATAMILSGCMNLNQAGRAIDRTIYLLVGTSLALGTAMTATGGVAYISNLIISLIGTSSPALVLSIFFLVV